MSFVFGPSGGQKVTTAHTALEEYQKLHHHHRQQQETQQHQHWRGRPEQDDSDQNAVHFAREQKKQSPRSGGVVGNSTRQLFSANHFQDTTTRTRGEDGRETPLSWSTNGSMSSHSSSSSCSSSSSSSSASSGSFSQDPRRTGFDSESFVTLEDEDEETVESLVKQTSSSRGRSRRRGQDPHDDSPKYHHFTDAKQRSNNRNKSNSNGSMQRQKASPQKIRRTRSSRNNPNQRHQQKHASRDKRENPTRHESSTYDKHDQGETMIRDIRPVSSSNLTVSTVTAPDYHGLEFMNEIIGGDEDKGINEVGKDEDGDTIASSAILDNILGGRRIQRFPHNTAGGHNEGVNKDGHKVATGNVIESAQMPEETTLTSFERLRSHASSKSNGSSGSDHNQVRRDSSTSYTSNGTNSSSAKSGSASGGSDSNFGSFASSAAGDTTTTATGTTMTTVTTTVGEHSRSTYDTGTYTHTTAETTLSGSSSSSPFYNDKRDGPHILGSGAAGNDNANALVKTPSRATRQKYYHAHHHNPAKPLQNRNNSVVTNSSTGSNSSHSGKTTHSAPTPTVANRSKMRHSSTIPATTPPPMKRTQSRRNRERNKPQSWEAMFDATAVAALSDDEDDKDGRAMDDQDQVMFFREGGDAAHRAGGTRQHQQPKGIIRNASVVSSTMHLPSPGRNDRVVGDQEMRRGPQATDSTNNNHEHTNTNRLTKKAVLSPPKKNLKEGSNTLPVRMKSSPRSVTDAFPAYDGHARIETEQSPNSVTPPPPPPQPKQRKSGGRRLDALPWHRRRSSRQEEPNHSGQEQDLTPKSYDYQALNDVDGASTEKQSEENVPQERGIRGGNRTARNMVSVVDDLLGPQEDDEPQSENQEVYQFQQNQKQPFAVQVLHQTPVQGGNQDMVLNQVSTAFSKAMDPSTSVAAPSRDTLARMDEEGKTPKIQNANRKKSAVAHHEIYEEAVQDKNNHDSTHAGPHAPSAAKKNLTESMAKPSSLSSWLTSSTSNLDGQENTNVHTDKFGTSFIAADERDHHQVLSPPTPPPPPPPPPPRKSSTETPTSINQSPPRSGERPMEITAKAGFPPLFSSSSCSSSSTTSSSRRRRRQQGKDRQVISFTEEIKKLHEDKRVVNAVDISSAAVADLLLQEDVVDSSVEVAKDSKIEETTGEVAGTSSIMTPARNRSKDSVFRTFPEENNLAQLNKDRSGTASTQPSKTPNPNSPSISSVMEWIVSIAFAPCAEGVGADVSNKCAGSKCAGSGVNRTVECELARELAAKGEPVQQDGSVGLPSTPVPEASATTKKSLDADESNNIQEGSVSTHLNFHTPTTAGISTKRTISSSSSSSEPFNDRNRTPNNSSNGGMLRPPPNIIRHYKKGVITPKRESPGPKNSKSEFVADLSDAGMFNAVVVTPNKKKKGWEAGQEAVVVTTNKGNFPLKGQLDQGKSDGVVDTHSKRPTTVAPTPPRASKTTVVPLTTPRRKSSFSFLRKGSGISLTSSSSRMSGGSKSRRRSETEETKKNPSPKVLTTEVGFFSPKAMNGNRSPSNKSDAKTSLDNITNSNSSGNIVNSNKSNFSAVIINDTEELGGAEGKQDASGCGDGDGIELIPREHLLMRDCSSQRKGSTLQLKQQDIYDTHEKGGEEGEEVRLEATIAMKRSSTACSI